jgi:Na+-driven multidrug efflux pump
MIFNFGSAILRATGDTKRPMYILVATGALNVALNLLFVIVFHMDVAGVALATIISQCVSAFLVVRCMMREGGAVHLELRQLRISLFHLKQILRIGFPSGVQGSLFSLSNVFIQSSINGFGEIIVAGNAAASNIDGFVYTSMNAFSQGTVSFVSQNYGAGRYDRICPILWRSLACIVTTGLVVGGGVVLFSPALVGLYSDNPAVIAVGVERLWAICLFYFLCGIMEVLCYSIRGLGYSMMPTLVTLLGACGLRILWIATVFQIPQYHTIHTIYLSYGISWAVTALAHAVCFIWAFRRLKRRMAAEPAES